MKCILWLFEPEKKKKLLFFSEEDDLNGKMKDNIKNIKRDLGKQNIIFHIVEDLGTGKNQKIDAFGSEIIRFYLCSKNFRKLFVKTKKYMINIRIIRF